MKCTFGKVLLSYEVIRQNFNIDPFTQNSTNGYTMFFIGIFGITEKEEGSRTATNARCSHCGNTGTQRIVVFRRYFHFFWIPLFPISRRAYAECTHCRRVLYEHEFDQELKREYGKYS